MSEIFISYSHKDKKYAQKLQQYLLEQGFNVWIDDRIEYGATWPSEIQRRLKECAAFILIMSPNSLESKAVQNEFAFVQELNKPVFPLLLDGDEWWNLKAIQYLDVKGCKLPPRSFIDCLAKFAPPSKPVSHPEVEEEKKKQAIKKNIIGIIGLILTIFLLFFFWDNIYEQIIGHPVFQTPTQTVTLTSIAASSTVNPTDTSSFGLTPVIAILPTDTLFPTETAIPSATATSTFTPEIEAPTVTMTSLPEYSCATVNEQPPENAEIRRGKNFKVMFTVVNNGVTVWPENLVLDITSNPYGTVDAPSLPMRVPRVQPGDSINVGPFDAKAPSKDGHYVVSFKLGDGFCLPYIAFDVVR